MGVIGVGSGALDCVGCLGVGREDLVSPSDFELDAGGGRGAGLGSALTLEVREGFEGVGVRAAGAVFGLGFDLATGAAGVVMGLVLALAGAEGFILAVALVGFIGSWFPWVTLRGRRRPATENCLKNSHEAGGRNGTKGTNGTIRTYVRPWLRHDGWGAVPR